MVPDGGELVDGVPAFIQANIELFVAVTVHDLRGNVHLTDLTQVTVTPIDNINDNTAPERLTDLRLNDRPNDDGRALLLDFTLSDADDVASYHVFAASYDFGGVVGQQGGDLATDPLKIATLERSPSLPLVITDVADDVPVIAGQKIWVAVVVMDSSGNAHTLSLIHISEPTRQP